MTRPTTTSITQPHLCNPLATIDQLSTSGSRLDGISKEEEDTARYRGAIMTQRAGILLRLPQDVIAKAIIISVRFYVGPEGGSLRDHPIDLISVASLYLAAKISSHPQSPRNVLNVWAYCRTSVPYPSSSPDGEEDYDPEVYYLTENIYLSQRKTLINTETEILQRLGFQVHVALPYTVAINYLQALDIFHIKNDETEQEGEEEMGQGQKVAKRTFEHLTAALYSPQLLYLTHQPTALATAGIYLAAREIGVKLPECEWWRVFDVEREELGFLVLAMGSMRGFAEREKLKEKELLEMQER
ncbi:MAG: 40s ribosomal protein L44e [Watsoniomyces obsoletus]|nr:MAG: 40s ribosomal protein L44e [Watsoniomyces obsoletus]